MVARSKVALKGDLLFTGVVGEETGSDGTRHLVSDGPSADMAIVGEPTELHPVVNVVTSVGRKLGFSPEISGGNFWTDASLLSREAHIPSLVCGPGDVAVAHGAGEYVKLDQLERAAKLYAISAHRICGDGGRTKD